MNASPALVAEARAQLQASSNAPVSEQWVDGNLYLFTGTVQAPKIHPCAGFSYGLGRAHVSALGLGDTPIWTSPTTLLAYRKMWGDFVMGTAQAALDCMNSLTAVPARWQGKLTLDMIKSELQTASDSIVALWNQHAGAKDSDILTFASEYLEDFQDVVRQVGIYYQPEILGYCPNAQLPKPPSVELQNNLILGAEGAKIIAHGLLQIFSIGANGAFEAYSGVVQGVKVVAGQVTNPQTIQEGVSAVKWVAIAVVVGGAVYLAHPFLKPLGERFAKKLAAKKA